MLENRLKKIFENTDVEAIILMNGGMNGDPNFFYVTQFTQGLFAGALLIVRPDSYTVFTDKLEKSLAEKQAGGQEVKLIDENRVWEQIRDEAGCDVIGCNELLLPTWYHNKLGEQFKRVEYASNALMDARVIKEKDEIDKIKKAADIVSGIADRIQSSDYEAVNNLMAIIKSNLKRSSRRKPEVIKALSEIAGLIPYFRTENELAAVIEYQMKKKGSRMPAFPTISSSGENSADPHYFSGEKKINKGDFMTLDFGAVYKNYVSDLTRTFFYKEALKENKDIYWTVLEVQLECIDEIEPGVKAVDVYRIYEQRLKDKGYKPIHGLGHMIGIEVHDCAHKYIINETKGNFEFKEGMVFTIEPGVYVKKLGGCRTEDDVEVTKNGCRVLTTAKKELEKMII